MLEKVDGRVAVLNNRDAGSREQVAALLATADALVEANQGAVLPLPRQLALPHVAPLSRRAPAVGAADCLRPDKAPAGVSCHRRAAVRAVSRRTEVSSQSMALDLLCSYGDC